mmetsp:Transcript_19252/g.44734  ORF Transcript_19252/g.44734 Transcript_19252/m.44734 type:complete len:106 (+) Transcript_19252:1478-1795(+)
MIDDAMAMPAKTTETRKHSRRPTEAPRRFRRVVVRSSRFVDSDREEDRGDRAADGAVPTERTEAAPIAAVGDGIVRSRPLERRNRLTEQSLDDGFWVTGWLGSVC